jgi:predicted nucleic acid-binding protein
LIVVDASVAVQWIVDEPGANLSAALIAREDMIAPSLFVVEVANALRRKMRDGQATEEQARMGISRAAERVDVRQFDLRLVERAFDISVLLRHPIYDCLYLALAESLSALFVTNGETFRKVAADHGLGRFVTGLPLESP